MRPRVRRPGKKLSEAELAETEKSFNLRLPEAYRAFLLENNGGIPVPDGICRNGEKEPTDDCNRFLGTGDWPAVFEEWKDEDEPRIPRRLLPMGEDSFGNYYCISVQGEDVGKVYFWHHEDELDQKRTEAGDVDDAAVSLVTDSFREFLELFAEDSEERETKKKEKPWRKMVEAGDVNGFKAWLNESGRINERDADGLTPLDAAIEEQQYSVVELLLDRGASFEKALGGAIGNRDWALAKRVIEKTAGKTFKLDLYVIQLALETCDDVSLMTELLDLGLPLDAQFQRGNALYHATEQIANPGIVKLLLDRGAKVGQYGHMGRSALTNAICAGNLESVKLLMEAGEKLYEDPTPKSVVKKLLLPNLRRRCFGWFFDYLQRRVVPEIEAEAKAEMEAKKKESAKNKDTPDVPNGQPEDSDPVLGFIKMQSRIYDHNRPKPAAYYLDIVPKAKRFKAEVIEHAAKLGQRPEKVD